MMSGYFTLMKTAFIESHHGRLEKLTEDKVVFDMFEAPERFIAAAQIGLTSIKVISGLVTIFFAPIIAKSFMAVHFIITVIICAACVIFVMMLFGEFLPNRIVKQAPEKFLIKYHTSFKWIAILMSPIITIVSKCASTLMTLLGMNEETEDAVTEDEVKELIEQGREDGTFEKEEQALVDRIFQLGDETAYSLMTPRTQIIWLDLSDPIEHNLKIIAKHNNEIIPVGNGSLDDCRGVLYIKDLLNVALTQKLKSLELTELLKKPIYVPRTMEAFRLLEKFRSTGVHEAMVLDEYGGVIGFITLNDLLTEIIGADSNTDTESTQFTMIGKDSWFIDGLYDIADFKKKFDIEELPEEEHDHYQTMGGFLTSYFGRIPNVGDRCEWNGLRFEIIGMDRARIDKVHVTRIN
ncbi:MAG: HlyC/CorC family transporter [Selenomonadaceae bacterium]|nr:HlyC/CorC family transporter [Selenomonadaceae bacterium]